jgi:asparagine synthetase B (glutamine-hydrolysing)
MGQMVASPMQALDPLEIYSGFVFDEPTHEPRLAGVALRNPRAVLEELLLDALSEPPCHVLYSGGRDSSLVLAAAARVARANGLPEPIPLTARFAKHPGTFEHQWQERTIAHLGLADWRKLELTDEFDALGTDARETLRRHGPIWPANGYNTRLYAREAGGGTILTGGGGDEIFTPWYLRRVSKRVLWSELPWRRALKWSAAYSLPGPAMRQLLRGRTIKDPSTPWLTPTAASEVAARLAAGPRHSSRVEVLRYLLTSRFGALSAELMNTLASEYGVRIVRPFWDPRFVLSLARAEPKHGFNSRTEAFVALFSDLLPQDVLRRTTKAHFTETMWGEHSRAFVQDWAGRGIDEAIVDPVALHAAWSAPMPHARVIGALHQAWLGSASAGG